MGEKESRSSTPPKKKIRFRNCIFNKEWLKDSNFNKWLAVHDDPNMARCIACNVSFSVKYDGIKAVKLHGEGVKHAGMLKSIKMSAVVTRFFSKKDSKQSDMVTAAEIAKTFHCIKHGLSYLSTDCGNKLDSQLFQDSSIASKIHLGRTKMEAIARNVLSPYSLEIVVRKLKEQNIPFSISTDASNKGNRKFFPLAVRFFDYEDGVQDYLLDFYEEAEESAESIKKSIISALNQLDLKIDNITAFSADNASVNYGRHCSVFQKLTEMKPKIIKANCNCHVLHNAAKHSLKLLSFDVESLVLKVFNEFSCSAKRVSNLKECFEFVQQDYHQVLRHISVRWLSLYEAVDRLLLSWEAIKTYFLQAGEEQCDRVIWKFIHDQADGMSEHPTLAECYIYFVHHFLSIFYTAIKTLEKSNILITDVYGIMSNLREKLKKRRDDSFFGFTVTQSLKTLSNSDRSKFKKECTVVYTRAIEYLEKWFDFDGSVFRLFECLKLTNQIPDLSEILAISSELDFKIEGSYGDALYDEICLLQKASPAFMNNENYTTADKWSYFFKNVEAPLLKHIVQVVLSIPASNAFVERIFSIMNQLWTDDRNRLSPEMVKAELCVRLNIKMTCSEFNLVLRENPNLVKAAKSNTKYHFKFQK